jgi:hypothetical protein
MGSSVSKLALEAVTEGTAQAVPFVVPQIRAETV